MQQQATHRNWNLYNTAQTNEKFLALQLLNDAVNYLGIPYDYKGNGRPQIGLDEMLKCCIIKVFNNFSSRRTIPDLRIAHAFGHIRQVPHFNSISNYMRDEQLTPYLHKLYKTLATPLNTIEHTFAADATGFSTFRKKNWAELRLEQESRMDFKKLHIVTGVRTNVIASARVTEGRKHDNPFYEGMVLDTSKIFRIQEISADPAYLSMKNCKITEDVGGIPFILPKSDTKPFSWHTRKGYAWQRMIAFWYNNREVFLKHYHQRSNVESTFSMMKRKFLPYVRSKATTAQYNEVLAKVVCHNLSVLSNAFFELNVNINFERVS